MRERHVFIWYCTWLACLFVKLQHDKTVDNPQEGSFVKHFKISKADPTLAFSSRNLYVHTTQNDCTISGEKIDFGSLVLLFLAAVWLLIPTLFIKRKLYSYVIIRRERWWCQYESVQGQYILGLFKVMSFFWDRNLHFRLLIL